MHADMFVLLHKTCEVFQVNLLGLRGRFWTGEHGLGFGWTERNSSRHDSIDIQHPQNKGQNVAASLSCQMVPGLLSCCALELRTLRGTELRRNVSDGPHLTEGGRRELSVRLWLRKHHWRQNCPWYRKFIKNTNFEWINYNDSNNQLEQLKCFNTFCIFLLMFPPGSGLWCARKLFRWIRTSILSFYPSWRQRFSQQRVTVISINCSLGLVGVNSWLCRQEVGLDIVRYQGGGLNMRGRKWFEYLLFVCWINVWIPRVLFSMRKAGGMGEICLWWGKGFGGKHVGDDGVRCPLLVAPVSFLHHFCLLLQLLEPSLVSCHELHVGDGKIPQRCVLWSRGSTCFAKIIIITHPGSQQSSVHVNVRRKQFVSAELQHGAINKRGLGVTQHFVFKSWHQ